MAVAAVSRGVESGADIMSGVMTQLPTGELGEITMPVVFWGRCSTAELQDPTISIPKQLTDVRERLMPGMVISAYYWDIESGAKDLADRGYGHAHELFDVPVPRDGGLQDLLREAARPDRPFMAVLCGSIDRAAREWIPALQLERDLERIGVPLLAANEPMTFDRSNPSTVLLRRFNMALAEWYRLNLLAESRKGMRVHTEQGWNSGRVPYGYLADRVAHPVPAKRAEGKTKTRLVPDPERASVVEVIYRWRVDLRLGYENIRDRLNANPAAYPPPENPSEKQRAGVWTAGAVQHVLANPKYTGYAVWNQRDGQRRMRDRSEWVWSTEPAHPALVSRELWEQVQEVAGGTERSRQGHGANPHPQTTRTYLLRSFVVCDICGRRMTGKDVHGKTYYRCKIDHLDPRTVEQFPDHPKTVMVHEDVLHAAIEAFFADHVFGERRSELLREYTDEAASRAFAEHGEQVASLEARIADAEKSRRRLIRELERLPDDEELAESLRGDIHARYRERESERRSLVAELLEVQSRKPDPPEDPSLLDTLPRRALRLEGVPEDAQRDMFSAFTLVVRYDKRRDVAEVSVVLSDGLGDMLYPDGESGSGPESGATLPGGAPSRTLLRQPTLPREGGGTDVPHFHRLGCNRYMGLPL
jgi:site-specific DNA recombinase